MSDFKLTETQMRSFFEAQEKAFGANVYTKFMLKYGRVYTPGPGTFTGGGEPKQCFANALHLALSNEDLTYCEGKVFIYGVAIDHAWCVDDDDNVYDPTLVDGDDGRIGGYYGMPFITEYVRKAAKKNKHYGVLDYFYAGKTAPDLFRLGLTVGQQEFLFPKKKRNAA